MSVQSQIDRIEQNVANTYAVLAGLGADMPTEQNSDNLAATAGTAKAVLYSAQTLTEAQKAQVRENIGVSASGVADGSITPEKTSFIVCEGTGETETIITPNFTNMVDPTSSDFQVGKRYNASASITSSSYDKTTCFVSNIFPIKKGDILRIKGVARSENTNATAPVFVAARLLADGTNAYTGSASNMYLGEPLGSACTDNQKCWNAISTDADGVITWTFCVNNSGINAADNNVVNTRIAGVATNGIENVIVTVNEEITYTEVTSGGKTYTLDEKIIVPRANGLKSGAKWFALGDSITEGWASAVDTSASSGYKQFLNTNEAERWVNIVADMNGFALTNYGVGGTGYAYAKSGTVNARAQVAGIDFSKCDFVTLAYGVNDWKGKATLGSMDDDVNTVDAFVPNMRYAIKKILADNPYCKIFVITPLNCRSLGTYDTNWGVGYANTDNASGPGLEDIFELEKTVCEYHGIELIDMTHCSIINRENIKTMLPDYVHPTVECHRMMARELAQKIAFR